MTYDELLAVVEQQADLGRERAERTTRAVLQTLAERISQGEAEDLAALLPAELAPWIATGTPAEGFDVDEFIRRVAEREEVEPEDAERHVRAVFTALQRAVTEQEWRDLVAELPHDFAPLLPRGPALRISSAETFWRRVADRAGVDGERARQTTEAVLETLAERIAGGEVDDLIARLPTQLHPPLRRGSERSDGQAIPISLDQFLARVAKRAGATPGEAREHARAVLLTLREAVGDDEFFDVAAQLPNEYLESLAVA
jgi:uncharacterized protein (DUF2267 family)